MLAKMLLHGGRLNDIIGRLCRDRDCGGRAQFCRKGW